MELNYETKEFVITLRKITNNRNELEVFHVETNKTRIYDIEDVIEKIDFNSISNRMSIYLNNDLYIHLSFDNDCVIGDWYTSEDEHINEPFAAYDFIND